MRKGLVEIINNIVGLNYDHAVVDKGRHQCVRIDPEILGGEVLFFEDIEVMALPLQALLFGA